MTPDTILLHDVAFQVGLIGIPGAVAAVIAALALSNEEPHDKARKETRGFPGDAFSPIRYVDSFKQAMAQKKELQILGIVAKTPAKNARDLVMEAITPIEEALGTGLTGSSGKAKSK